MSKHIIPYRIVLYTGLSYTIPNQLVSVAFDVSNVLDAQVCDNFYLQKPGRVFSSELRFHLVIWSMIIWQRAGHMHVTYRFSPDAQHPECC